MNNVCPDVSNGTLQCNPRFIVAQKSSENGLLNNGQASASSAVKNEERNEHDSHVNPLSNHVFIDLTQTSDEESDVTDLFSEPESSDSDLEIISHRSRSPLTISLQAEPVEVSAAVVGPTAGNSSSSAEGSSGLSGTSVLTPSETHISVAQHHPSRPHYIFPISPVNAPLPSQTRSAIEHVLSVSPPTRTFHRPRDDVIDWLNEIEPFNPMSNVSNSVSNTSVNNSSGLTESGQPSHWGGVDRPSRHVHCAHCGHSVHFDNSNNDHAQPSTSARRSNELFPQFRPLQESHLRSNIAPNHRRYDPVNSNSVLERMLSTPPLPVFEDHVQQPVSSNLAQSNVLAEPMSRYQSQLQHFAMNFGIPPPAHTGNTSAAVAVGPTVGDYSFSNRSRVEVPFTNFVNLNQPPPDLRRTVIPAAAHGGVATGFTGPILPALRSDILSHLSSPGQLQLYGQQHIALHPPQHVEPLFAQSQRANLRYFNPPSLNQPHPFLINPAPVDFLPASVILPGFYPDFPGFGLSSTQIERHTVKYVLEKAPKLEYGAPAAKKPKASYTDESEASCSVCLEGFEEGQTMRRLTCQHLFHADCVDEWLKRRPTCPNCRVDVRRSSNNNNSTSTGEPSSSTSTSNNYSTHHHHFHIPHRNPRAWPFTTN